MILDLVRAGDSPLYRLGQLWIDKIPECYTLEDGKQTIKVHGKTSIPDGRFAMKLRTEGGMHARYLAKYGPLFHRGMLWITDIPDFDFVYFHIGNTALDTEGCVLVGGIANSVVGSISSSEDAYKHLYPIVSKELIAGNEVWVNIRSASSLL